ncbi:MAG: hypothetical protein RBT22_00550 [Aliarcobacter sp.]|jgi:hypothetical protein|nr:hypothetical protein [Aliarcobacter sp.]
MDDESRLKNEKRKKIFGKIFRKIEKAQKNEKIIQEIMKYKYIAITVLIIIFLLFFQIWSSQTPEFKGKLELEPLIEENKVIEADINQQILEQKAEEIGVRPIENPNIKDYLNLYLQKNTIIWDFATNEQTTYNGFDLVVKAVKLANGNTVFTLNNKQYFIKE